MKIKWLGHAAFLITADDGTRIITDPYEQNDRLTYGKINESAHIVTTSHDHFDHSNVAAVSGNPQVVRGGGSKEVKGIKFVGIPSHHDEAGGGQRGSNTIFCFTVDDMKICHLGDLGHRLSPEQVAQIGQVDVLLLPVGGFFTIDAAAASDIYDALKPRLTIPIHFKTEKVELPIGKVDDFLKGKASVERVAGSEVELTLEKLPPAGQIIVLKHAL